ncbi:GNAT family N-acetyltransferase [Pseudomonas sp. 21LCFQ010]|uniref:GNAT family N-acetyltransferase n=1 Tax=Pseudomonas sp. 21LCFQ010 TaxID=2957506 RepID=UPI0020981C08|nr:GNAT family N-acetyltransferase [Pseudomonas sp. 21LCFQ010]MCO8164786.1 GNAT family N-acetyltransferase [Pseudomonas sp. 21LCFQ010]
MHLPPIIRKALPADIPGILSLQKANQQSQGGKLSAELPAERLAEMLSDTTQIVACRGEQVVGFLLTTSQAINRRYPAPVLEKTIEAFGAIEPDTYIYGPVCVSASERGQGLAQRLFQRLLELEPGRQGVLFIRDDNPASLSAHRKMGMASVAQFHFKGGLFHVFAYRAA